MSTLRYLKRTGEKGYYRYWYWHTKLGQVIKSSGLKPSKQEIAKGYKYFHHPYEIERHEFQVGDIVFHNEKQVFAVLENFNEGKWQARSRQDQILSGEMKNLIFISPNLYPISKLDFEATNLTWGIKTEEERNFLEKIGAQNVMDYIIGILQNISITEITLKEIHKQLMSQVFLEAGEYRTIDMVVGKFESPTVPYPEVSQQMSNFFNLFSQKYSNKICLAKDEVVQALLEMHIDIARIHPFIDGNGRVIRFFASIIAKKFGYYLVWDKWFNKVGGKKKYHYAVRNAIKKNPIYLRKIIDCCLEA